MRTPLPAPRCRPPACALPRSRTGKPWGSPCPILPARHAPPQPQSHAPAPLLYFQHRHVAPHWFLLCPCEQRDVTTPSAPGRRRLSHQLWLKPSSSQEGNTPGGQQGSSSGQTLPGGGSTAGQHSVQGPPPRGTAPQCRGLPGGHHLSHVQLLRMDEAPGQQRGGTGARAAGEAKSLPAGRSQPAGVAKSTLTSRPWHPAARCCGRSRELCPSVLFWSLEEGFNAWLAVGAWPPPLR